MKTHAMSAFRAFPRKTTLGTLALALILAAVTVPAPAKGVAAKPTLTQQLVTAASKGRIQQVTRLLKAGADVNGEAQLDGTSMTPLQAAGTADHLRVCSLLIKKGAKLNNFDSDGMSLLLYSAYFGDYPMANLLLKNGADLYLRSLGAATPLQAAAQAGRNKIVGLLLAYGAIVNSQDGGGDTPLMLAVKEKHLSTVNILLDHGARTFFKDKQGKTALDYARKSGDKAMLQALESVRENHNSRPRPFDQPILAGSAARFQSELLETMDNLSPVQRGKLKYAMRETLADFKKHVERRVAKFKADEHITGPAASRVEPIDVGAAQREEIFRRTGRALPADGMRPLKEAIIRYALFNQLSPKQIIAMAKAAEAASGH